MLLSVRRAQMSKPLLAKKRNDPVAIFGSACLWTGKAILWHPTTSLFPRLELAIVRQTGW
jgi:hypothetical protein